MIICGIGSRSTPKSVCDEMTKIGQFCLENKITVRSGHAEGADYAFEQGAAEFCHVFLPWKSFNRELKMFGTPFLGEPTSKQIELVKKYHPTPDKLSQGTIKLMARNCCQILGSLLDSPVDAVVCWTSNGDDKGGTGQSIRMARDFKIPILNMFHSEWNTHIKVQERLIQLRK